MGPIQELAADLGVEDRTLRRAASQGTLRCRRVGPRRLRLSAGEREYLRDHWALLAQLRRLLRTQRSVRLAVLYGSVARGEEDAGSDLDLLVSFAAGSSLRAGSQLAAHLEAATAHRVDVADLARVEADTPLLLSRVLDEGRVLVDRDGHWGQLRDRRRAIRARGQRAYRRQMDRAARAIEELTGE
jgi:predicted nucleotidyltransferase